MTNSFVLKLVTWYLLGVPLISSINGLSMHVLGVSMIGPTYHGSFSLLLIVVALISDSVEKSWPTIAVLFGIFGVVVAVQLTSGFSYLSDVGELYKWFMPLLLFAVYYRWRYLRTPKGRTRLLTVFQTLPLWYSALIIVSLAAYLVTGFRATLFEEGVERFTGFTWAYNPMVNVFFICAYVNYVLEGTGLSRALIYGFAFFNLRSKAALAYYAVAALGLSKRLSRKAGQFSVSRGVFAVPALILVLAFGIRESLKAAAIFGDDSTGVSATLLYQEAVAERGLWVAFAVQDVPQWPLMNLLFGNGIEIDRRLLNPFWAWTIGFTKYPNLDLGKQNKTPELDFLGPLDMFGVIGMACFVAVFYVYPFAVRPLPAFRLYYGLLVALSLVGGHMINNPQATTLLVFFILVTRDYSDPREAEAN